MTDLDLRFQAAVQQFRTGRDEDLQRQIEAGNVDAGSRGAVTSDGHMGAIEELVVDLLLEAGLERLDVKIRVKNQRPQTRLALPGYYRPEKQWDLLVVSGDQLITAIEFKSQVGSIGNNYNNRIEGATDLWTAFREGQLGTSRPFIGYFFLLGVIPVVHRPVRVCEPYFPVDPAFGNASYARRYSLLCQRLVLGCLYDATCLTLATRDSPTAVSHPAPEQSFQSFVAKLQGHVTGMVRSA